MPSRRDGGSFAASTDCRDTAKPCSLQIARRTAARLSAKVGRCLWYQALDETWTRARQSRRDASKATIENSPSRHGVVRTMALSDCPSSNALRQAGRRPSGDSGSSELEVMRPAADAASGVVGWSVA